VCVPTQAELVMQIPHRQKGLALLMLVFVLVLAITTYALKSLNAASIQNERNKNAIQALSEAKMALIGYAITYDDTHSGELYGYLPCPDTDASDLGGAGSQPNCGIAGEAALGRLPWKTLKVSPVKDGHNECLWYAVSGSFKNSPKQPLTPNTLGQLKVVAPDGSYYMASDIDPVVALVIAPGPVVAGQNRTDVNEDEYCGGNYVAANYLDSANGISNADATDSTFVIADNATFNDQLILIKQSEVFKNYCAKYAQKLADMVNLATNTNDCNDAGSPNADCVDFRDNVQYCTLSTCKTAADVLIASPCLDNPLDVACQAAVNELKACNA
jgi:type II secretory pathway pseudopilin PulG